MGRILVVEDAHDTAKLYLRAFHDHDVKWVQTAWMAISALEDDPHFDLIILDMNLPEIHGLIVLQHLRKMPEGKDLNVFVISAAEDWRKQAELVGIQKWMSKPVDVEMLLDAAAPYLGAQAANAAEA